MTFLKNLKSHQNNRFFSKYIWGILKNNCTKSLTKLKSNFKTKEIRKDMSRRLKKLWLQIKVIRGNV